MWKVQHFAPTKNRIALLAVQFMQSGHLIQFTLKKGIVLKRQM